MERDTSKRTFWRLTLAVLAATAGLSAGWAMLRRAPAPKSHAPLVGQARDPALQALRRHLAARGFEVVVEGAAPAIFWNDFVLASHGLADYLRAHTFTCLLKKAGARAPDVYRGRARVTPAGVPIEVSELVNLTRTDDGEETKLAVQGDAVAFANRIDGALKQVVLLDFRGEPASPDATAFDRFMDAVANWQEYGDGRGVGRRIYDLAPGLRDVALRFDDEHRLIVGAGGVVAHIAGDSGELLANANVARAVDGGAAGAPLLTAVAPSPRPKRMLIDWIANTIRRAIGEERFEWVKVYALGVKDKWQRLRNALFGASAPSADEVETSRVVAAHAPVRRLRIEFGQDPNWPPPPLEPIVLSPRLPGEGQWVDIYDFDLRNAGAPPPLLKTIIRPDPRRPHAAVRIVLIDPRQVELSVVAGTKHPQSTTGNQGDGLIPRDEKTMSRLLAAFNGGFKTMHGSYGMMVRKKVIVPMKAGAATIARMADGRVAMGTWDLPDGSLLPGALSIRQNLPPLIEGGVINPTGLTKWGNTVMNLDSDGKHTYRSALGVTKYGHLIYVWGDDLSHETMAEAMLRAGCEYAVHLDMNYGHSRFEFYRVYDDASIGRAREDRPMFHEGPVRYQAKKLSQAQISWLYPRYIKRDIRDFFYLTLRRVFPYVDDPRAPAWSTDGLPEELREWPPLVVRAKTNVGGLAVTLFKLDAARLRPHLRQSATARVPVEAKQIAAGDLQRLGALIGLGASAARPRDGGSTRAPSAPATTPTPAAAPADARLFVDVRGRLHIAARAPSKDLPEPAHGHAWLAGRRLVEGGKLVVGDGGKASPLGALGLDARGDLVLAYGEATSPATLARALADAGVRDALTTGARGFLRVFTKGEREGEIVATDLDSGARAILRELPLAYSEPFLYVVPAAPGPRVLALDALPEMKRAKAKAGPVRIDPRAAFPINVPRPEIEEEAVDAHDDADGATATSAAAAPTTVPSAAPSRGGAAKDAPKDKDGARTEDEPTQGARSRDGQRDDAAAARGAKDDARDEGATTSGGAEEPESSTSPDGETADSADPASPPASDGSESRDATPAPSESDAAER